MSCSRSQFLRGSQCGCGKALSASWRAHRALQNLTRFYTWPRSCEFSWASTVLPEDNALPPSCLRGKNAFSVSVLLAKSFFFPSRIKVHRSSALPQCRASPCSQCSSPLSTPTTVRLWSWTYSMGFFPRHSHFLAAATMSSRLYSRGLAP